MPKGKGYRRNGRSPGGGVYVLPGDYRPPVQHDAHVSRWRAVQANARPKATPTSTARPIASLPPSLAPHEAELTGRVRASRQDETRCTAREAAELLELRPEREVDSDADADADKQESIPEVSRREDAPGDAEGTADADIDVRREEPMQTVSQKIDRLLEIERQQAALTEEQDRLLADPDVDRLLEMAKAMRRRRPGHRPRAETPTPTPTPTEKPAQTARVAPAALAGERLAQVLDALNDAARNYRDIASGLEQRPTDVYKRLVILMRRGQAEKTAPGMFRRAS